MRGRHYLAEPSCLRLQKHLNTTVDVQRAFCDPSSLCESLEGDWLPSEQWQVWFAVPYEESNVTQAPPVLEADDEHDKQETRFICF